MKKPMYDKAHINELGKYMKHDIEMTIKSHRVKNTWYTRLWARIQRVLRSIF